MSQKTFLPIKRWSEEDRPREKLLLKGKAVLSEAELIAILIGSGNAEETAVSLSQRILQASNNNLNELGKRTVNDLTVFKGIGEAKAVSIVAALELGRRRKEQAVLDRPVLKSSLDAFSIMRDVLDDLPHEEFWIILLNRANKLLQRKCISKGGFTGTVADPKMIFKEALLVNACAIILFHNHPSGRLKPSMADKKLTKQLQQAGAFLEIPVLDHIITGENHYFSFADEGIL